MKKYIVLIVFIILILFIFSKNISKKSDNIKFGKYYINNDKKLDSIEWLVLDENNGKKLLVSKYVLDATPYNKQNTSITWDKSDIRKFLNNDFYNLAFSNNEKKHIVLTKNKAIINPNHSDNTNIGSDTKDKVFLLSFQEISKYMNNRLVKPTKYAKEKGCYTNEQDNASWWTRSPGISETSPEYLATSGDFGTRQHKVSEDIIGLRPAIWVKDI